MADWQWMIDRLPECLSHLEKDTGRAMETARQTADIGKVTASMIVGRTGNDEAFVLTVSVESAEEVETAADRSSWWDRMAREAVAVLADSDLNSTEAIQTVARILRIAFDLGRAEASQDG